MKQKCNSPDRVHVHVTEHETETLKTSVVPDIQLVDGTGSDPQNLQMSDIPERDIVASSESSLISEKSDVTLSSTLGEYYNTVTSFACVKYAPCLHWSVRFSHCPQL